MSSTTQQGEITPDEAEDLGAFPEPALTDDDVSEETVFPVHTEKEQYG